MGLEIKHYRRLQGLTQSQLGQKIWEGISEEAAQSRIKRVESERKRLTHWEFQKVKKILTQGFGQDSESRAFEEYCMVKKQYPEVEAWVKTLRYAILNDRSINISLTIAAWHGLEIMAKQKQILFSEMLKERKVG